jgi:hypothetical protein
LYWPGTVGYSGKKKDDCPGFDSHSVLNGYWFVLDFHPLLLHKEGYFSKPTEHIALVPPDFGSLKKLSRRFARPVQPDAAVSPRKRGVFLEKSIKTTRFQTDTKASCPTDHKSVSVFLNGRVAMCSFFLKISTKP